MNTTAYKVCSRCVMDTSDPQITFDDQGYCNHCRTYFKRHEAEMLSAETAPARLQQIVDTIKRFGKNKPYDCLIGLSGGADSSMVAVTCKELGLRPLAVHFDNGWDTELAVRNIELLVKKLRIDYRTYIVNWEEFRDVQISFLRAGVSNAEIPTDHAIGATMLSLAARNGIRYIIGGGNLATEGIMPEAWSYDPRDLRHLKAIHARFGKKPLRTFPTCGLLRTAYYLMGRRIRFVNLLNLIHYNKAEAVALLERDYGWRNYDAKHFESMFTRFFQGYYLPRKFGYDKRRAHYSSLICAGQMTREQAIEQLNQPPYSPQQAREDIEYVRKKLGLDPSEFDQILNSPPIQHEQYPRHEIIFGMTRTNFIGFAKKLVMET